MIKLDPRVTRNLKAIIAHEIDALQYIGIYNASGDYHRRGCEVFYHTTDSNFSLLVDLEKYHLKTGSFFDLPKN